MASHDTAATLVIGPHAQQFLNTAPQHELVDIWIRLFSLLEDPAVDGNLKTDLAFFPYGPELGVRQLLDDTYVLTYRASANNDVHVLTIHRLADLPYLDPRSPNLDP